jgi:hypothetical protein
VNTGRYNLGWVVLFSYTQYSSRAVPLEFRPALFLRFVGFSGFLMALSRFALLMRTFLLGGLLLQPWY